MPWGDDEIEIEPRHLAIWQKHPNAVFDVVFSGRNNPRRLYVLGGWSDPADERPDQ
jgi:hypothetical protein